MKYRKKALILFLIFVTAIGLGGCTKIGNNLNDNMVEYMNNKYPDDTFYYKEPFGGGIGTDGHQIIVSSQKYPDAEIHVYYITDDSGNEIYRDNYRGIVYEEQTRECIENVIASCLDGEEYYLDYEPADTWYFDDIPDGSFESYVASHSSGIDFMCIVDLNGKELDRQEFEEKYKNAVVENHLCTISTRFFFDDGSEALEVFKETENKDVNAWFDYMNSREYVEFYASMSSVGTYKAFKWKEKSI